MVGWDVVSNIPDGVAPNGKQLWQAKWEENLEKTHRYSQSKGLKVCHVMQTLLHCMAMHAHVPCTQRAAKHSKAR